MTPASLCTLAAEAYNDPPTFSVAGDVHCTVTPQVDGAVVAAFRGTVLTNALDWLRDFDDFPDASQIGTCFRGFLTGAQQALPNLRGLGRPLILTGHSLGGALAIAAAAFLVQEGRAPLFCTTFGAPRVSLDGELTKILASVPGYRYRCGDDPIPLVPWAGRPDRDVTRIGRATLDPIADHMIAAYARAIIGIDTAPQTPRS